MQINQPTSGSFATATNFSAGPATGPNVIGRASLIVVGLILATLAAYYPVGSYGFVNLDDDAYVEVSPMVNQGVRPAALVWALTATHASNWHPLTTLSHILDCEIFGLHAAPMHWENLLWHGLNSGLVFIVWWSLTGAVWRPALVAALFALHPMHVESVAWISERKDLLSTFFWLLGLWTYANYVRNPSTKGYAAVAVVLLLALLSKPMAVTFPCTLLLLDYWPLRRWPSRSWAALLSEKTPLFALVAAHSIITFVVQYHAGAANYAARFGSGERAGNAVISYARYLGKTIWPETLSPLYFFQEAWPLWTVLGALLLIALITLVAWSLRQTRPWFAFGWLWFLGTLVPVIGIVQVGAQSMADRYSYVPLLGIFTLFAWGGASLAERWPRCRPVIASGAIIVCGLALVRSRQQVTVWENSITLYERSIASGEDNPAIRYLLAVAYQAAGRPEAESVDQFQRAVQMDPGYINARTQLARIAIGHQQFDQASKLLEENCRLEPLNPGVHMNRGAFYRVTGRPTEAIPFFIEALRLNPNYAEAHHELSQIFLKQNRLDEGRQHLEAAVRVSPWDADLLCELGTLVGNLRYFDQARHYLTRAIWIKPDFARARDNLRVFEQYSAAKS